MDQRADEVRRHRADRQRCGRVDDGHHRGNAAFYEDATEPGFLYVDIDGNTFAGTFYDASGNVSTRTFTKQ